jgi:hypothetical protein
MACRSAAVKARAPPASLSCLVVLSPASASDSGSGSVAPVSLVPASALSVLSVPVSGSVSAAGRSQKRNWRARRPSTWVTVDELVVVSARCPSTWVAVDELVIASARHPSTWVAVDELVVASARRPSTWAAVDELVVALARRSAPGLRWTSRSLRWRDVVHLGCGGRVGHCVRETSVHLGCGGRVGYCVVAALTGLRRPRASIRVSRAGDMFWALPEILSHPPPTQRTHLASIGRACCPVPGGGHSVI